MIFPIRTDAPLRATPYMNWAIILLNVAAFVAQQSIPSFESALKLYPKDPAVLAFFTKAAAAFFIAAIDAKFVFELAAPAAGAAPLPAPAFGRASPR